MATVERHVAADPSAVWAVLADGWSYSNWVASTAHVRAVDAGWPAVGAKLHHTQGTWPIILEDEAVVESAEPERALVLLARGRPFGEARVELQLHPHGAGTRVVMTETPVSGPGSWLHTPLSEILLARRNTETLARLAATVEKPTAPPT